MTWPALLSYKGPRDNFKITILDKNKGEIIPILHFGCRLCHWYKCNCFIRTGIFGNVSLLFTDSAVTSFMSQASLSLLSLETVTLSFKVTPMAEALQSDQAPECHQPFIFTAPHWSYDRSHRVSVFPSITSLPSVITPLNLSLLPDRIYTLSALMRSKYLQRCRSGTRTTPTTSTCPIQEGSTSPWRWKMLKSPGVLEGTRCWTCMR